MILQGSSLDDVEYMYWNGRAMESEVLDYLRKWNAGRLVQAVLRNGRIRKVLPLLSYLGLGRPVLGKMGRLHAA